MIIGIDASRANHKERTGVEEYAFQMIENLKSSLPESVRVILYSDEPLQGDLLKLPANWESKVLKWAPKRLWTQIRLSLEMLINPPDVLFIPAHVFPFVHPKNTVMTIHDIAADKFPTAYNFFERWYSLYSAEQALKKLTKIIVPSEFTKRELINKFEHKKDNIFVVPHGIKPVKEIINDDQNILQKTGINKPYFLFVGRVEIKKNITVVLEALNDILECQLVLAGKPGHGYEQVKEMINNSSRKKDILELGYVNENDLEKLYKEARAFVFPSLYEGFGLPVLEALLRGKKVLAAKGSALEEVGNSSVVYLPHDDIYSWQTAMKKCLEFAISEEETKNNQEFASRFSWDRSAQKTAEILLSVEK